MSPLRKHSGVSLIEALVAMAAMAFGMLGVAGLQSTLRMNADIAKQRSEAVRIAQEMVETNRQFSAIESTAGRRAFADIVDQSAGVTRVGTNATFTHFETVADGPPGTPFKSLKVRVSWLDRVGATQEVALITNIAKVSPELSGALSIPGSGSLVDNPGGRNLAVPKTAIEITGTGESTFSPPGAPVGTSWIFNNSTGFITQICSPVCVPVSYRLLTGFVRFSTESVASFIDSENPASTSIPGTGVSFSTSTNPADFASPTTCFVSAPVGDTYVEYFCAVDAGVSGVWSGFSKVTGIPTPSEAPPSDPNGLLFRVCRYTPVDSAVTQKNEDHPLIYTNVSSSLINQNFLIIRGGDGTTPFSCPDDKPATAVNGNTYRHQPYSL